MKSDVGQIGVNKEIESFEDMKHHLQNMESYKKSNKLFNLHLKISEEINNKFKSNNLNNVIEMEQEILSGVDSNANPIESKDLIKNFGKLKIELENNNQRNDILRILSIMMTSLEISENDFFDNAGQLSKEEKKIFTNFNQLGINFSEKKKKIFERKDKSLENKVERKKLKKKLSEIEYNVLRIFPKIQNIIEKSANCELDINEFPFIDYCTYPKKKKKSKTIFSKDNDDSNNDCPEYIYFNIGGISHNEITAINNLILENKIPYNVIIGSTGIYNAEDYLKELQDLNNNFQFEADDSNNKNSNINDDNNISNSNDNEIITYSKRSDHDKSDIELEIIDKSHNEGMSEKI